MKTRIETYDITIIKWATKGLWCNFHENKDWNFVETISYDGSGSSSDVTSMKTRIETGEKASQKIGQLALWCNFHENKDWNFVCSILSHQIHLSSDVTSMKTRIETRICWVVLLAPAFGSDVSDPLKMYQKRPLKNVLKM